MFQNNNEAVIKRLAKSSLRANKRRNVFIILTIAISTCLMATISLATLGSEQERINDIDGMYQAAFFNVSQDTLAALKADPTLDGAGEYFSIMEKRVQDYSVNCIYMDNDMLRLSKSTWEGSLPTKQEDVMLERAYLTKLGMTANIGDTVLLDFGEGEREYHVTGFFQYKSKSASASNFSVIRYQKSFLTNDASRIVYIRIADSSGMSAKTLENAIFDVGQRHGLARKDVSMSSRYFNVIEPVNMGNLLIMVGIAAIVAVASVLVIYSIFYISVTGKVREYGQLRTIGTTQKQIKKIVLWEGCHLSAIGIPMGLLVSCIIAFCTVPKGWNTLTTFKVCFALAILTFIVVLFAIHRPMKIAASTSPMEAIRYSAASDTIKTMKIKKLHRRITPIRLAVMNFSRNRKKSILTLFSLGFSGILLMCAASYSGSISIEGMARGDLFAYGDYHLSLTTENSDNSDGYAISRIQQNNPLDEAMKQQILALDGVAGIQTEEEAKIHYILPNGTREESYVSGFSKSETDLINSRLESGTCDYRQCMEQNGIIVMIADLYKQLYGREPVVGDKLTFEFYTPDGIIQKEYTVLGVMNGRLKDGTFLMPEEALLNVMGTNINAQFSIAAKPEKKDAVEAALKSITSTNSSLKLETLDELVDEAHASMQPLFAVIYTIVLIIAFFGIINLINTVVTNIFARKQELGVLQAIGLSNKQLNQMLQSEGLIFTLGTIIATLTVGTGLGWLLCEGIRHFSETHYIDYHFPLRSVSLFIAVFLIIQIIITHASSKSLKKQSLVERIREL